MMVFQEFDQLLPWKTVRDNMMFPLLTARKLSRKDPEARARAYIEKVGLTRVVDAYPHTLSGGMKQRVAIARGMAMEPDILLMDEPFAALDALTRRTCQDELLQLWNETKFTVLFVTHSIPEAIRVGNRILLMSRIPAASRPRWSTSTRSPMTMAAPAGWRRRSTISCSPPKQQRIEGASHGRSQNIAA